MIWANGYSATCYMTVVDPATWRDSERIELTGGSVKRSAAELIEAADLSCVNYDQSKERWIRVWMDTRQQGSADHVALFTGLATSPDRDINGRYVTNTVQCYSVLKPAQDILLPLGWYAPAGANGAGLAFSLLSFGPAPVVIEGVSPNLTEHIIAEENETNLSMARAILAAINWHIRIDGNGTIRIRPAETEQAASFDHEENDMVETKLKVSYDWFSCPNVFRAISDDMTAVARDDDPDSRLSTVTRGREIWAQETNCKLGDNEGIAAYAGRRLEELQQASRKISYDRRFHPAVTIGDRVRIHYPGQNISGIFEITSQTIDIAKTARTSEEVKGIE